VEDPSLNFADGMLASPLPRPMIRSSLGKLRLKGHLVCCRDQGPPQQSQSDRQALLFQAALSLVLLLVLILGSLQMRSPARSLSAGAQAAGILLIGGKIEKM
jgi:hypothetical protein